MDYLHHSESLHQERNEESAKNDIKTKAFTALALLLYNLDETSQKS